MQFFERLIDATQQEQRALHDTPLIRRALQGQLSQAQYLAFLTQAYYHTRHSVPLLMTGGGRLVEDMEWLRDCVTHYIEEGLGLQERILDDIAACGGDVQSVRDGQPALATELMVSYAYDSITRGNPVSIMGIMYVLQGANMHFASEASVALQRSLGLPNAAFSYLRDHCRMDMEQVQSFRRSVNRLRQPDDQDSVLHTARVLYRLYADMMRSTETLQ